MTMYSDTFQKLKTKVNRGITTISVKTSSSLEKSKIKTHIDSLEKEIQSIIRAIGEDTYVLWQNNSTDISIFGKKLEIVKQKRDEVTQLTIELNSIYERDKQILGSNQENSKVERNSERIVCPGCGSRYELPVKFCRKCGYNLQKT